MLWPSGFFDVGSHRQALLRHAAEFLLNQNPTLAFFCADRRIRIGPARARDFLVHAAALRQLGHPQAAWRDVQAALRDDGADVMVLRQMLSAPADRVQRASAARLILDSPAASGADLGAALACLGRLGEDLILAVVRNGSTLSGRVSWTGEGMPDLEWAGKRRKVDPTDAGQVPHSAFRTAAFELPTDRDTAVVVTARIDKDRSRHVVVPADQALELQGPEWQDAARPDRPLTVIVPAYKDAEATAQCLASVVAQGTAGPVRLIVIDDCSPDADVSALLRSFCASAGATLIVNDTNLGFTRSVNKALAHCPPGDVLLLNSDVVLSDEALARLRHVAYSAERIGTVSPLSNDSSVTSFPRPNVGNPFLSEPERRAVDAAAHGANDRLFCDVIANIGFCLFIRQDCLRDVGMLNPIYGRGYYEDIEFCLKARQKGYRNVAALGIYVGHRSGRSFQSAKPALASRNGSVLLRRFPAYTSDVSRSFEADPLRAARSAIEERLVPAEPVHLLVGRSTLLGPLLHQRAMAIGAAAPHRVIQLSWRHHDEGLEAQLKAFDGAAPQSLFFRLDQPGLSRLAAYLSRLVLRGVEFAEMLALPDPLRHLLSHYHVSQLVLVGTRALAIEALDWIKADPPDPQPGRALAEPPPTRGLVAADAMAQAFLDRSGTGVPVRHQPPAGRVLRRIGVVAPVAHPAVDRLIATLSRHLLGRLQTVLIVLGAAVDDLALMTTGNVLVSGPIDQQDYAESFEHYAVDAVFSPYRTALFGPFAAVTDGTALQRCYFDWSGGHFEARADDVVLEWDLPDDAVCTRVVTWCGDSAVGRDVRAVG